MVCRSMDVHVSSLFSTPLWRFDHSEPMLLSAWARHVLTLERESGESLQLTNQGGWHSGTDLVSDPQLQGMFQWLAGCVTRALQDFGWDFARANPCFNNAWAMVNRRGHSVRAHLHPNSLFSGVLYLTAPEGSGAIAFLDPRSGAQMLLPPLHEPAGEFAQGRVCCEPAPGRLLLFPAWLWHEVEQTSSDEPRVCVSFNVGMKPL
jgi:uncharacterized protein (TIGR02466 family)